jgi:hypothetical protein
VGVGHIMANVCTHRNLGYRCMKSPESGVIPPGSYIDPCPDDVLACLDCGENIVGDQEAEDWTEGPCEPMVGGCTGAPHRPGCPDNAAHIGRKGEQ